jgi:NitT/TauT family transport system substrate-binding protein
MKSVKASMMNAVHDLPLLVARDEGFFRDQGLDVEILKTPGSGQRDSDHQALRSNIFDRTMESLYDKGACDQFRMCEWGVMKRAVESTATSGHRPAKIVALGSGDVHLRHRYRSEIAHLRARAAEGQADRRQPV